VNRLNPAPTKTPLTAVRPTPASSAHDPPLPHAPQRGAFALEAVPTAPSLRADENDIDYNHKNRPSSPPETWDVFPAVSIRGSAAEGLM